MAVRTADEVAGAAAVRVSLPLLAGIAVYVLLLALGDRLLGDPDTYWHIVVGRWIVEHQAFPHADMFSATARGAPWIAKEWLSQVLYAGAYAVAGWTAVVVLAAAAVAAALALLARFLLDELPPIPALALVTAALVLTAPHIVARPHVLALPVMVAWVAALVRAADRGNVPSLKLLPLMVAWANLHGGFTLGLALIAPIALEAVLACPASERRTAALAWLRFGVLAVLAGCITPYGWESILVTYRILGLGTALTIIGEWQPQDFTRVGAFELCLLLAVGFALYRGFTLPPLRIVVLLGLLHLALAHSRNAELIGLLGPLVIARPLARQIGSSRMEAGKVHGGSMSFADGAALIAAIAVTCALIAAHSFAPSARVTPALAVEAIKRAGAGPIFNDYDFGGYLIHAGLAPFIDGRTELYGGAFTARHHRAVTLQNVPDFLRLLEDYRIGATLLAPTTPAAGLLDVLPGWKRLYADDVAVVHVKQSSTGVSPKPHEN
jgi:hypothetical protein